MMMMIMVIAMDFDDGGDENIILKIVLDNPWEWTIIYNTKLVHERQCDMQRSFMPIAKQRSTLS